jgi:hypothetical protein
MLFAEKRVTPGRQDTKKADLRRFVWALFHAL